ncbi:MAG TPA: DNA polymerase IV [Candidatus Dormibacteraeota bacterium]|nr:DNA polymerase IV [Candidatus Dormibacteraeota bacterium]
MNARPRRIVHVDVDAFFASVEQALNPRLRGRPVLVGRGVVASASYPAKRRGVRTAMSMREALRLCPDAAIVAGEYEHYADAAARVRRILLDFIPVVETASLDDFYLDFTGAERLYPDFRGTLRRLQQRVEDETGLSVSIGAGTSKLIAAAASQVRRPRGLRVVPPGEEETFLAPLPLGKLHGIGPAHAASLGERGIHNIGELRRLPLGVLAAAFGPAVGRQFWERARGIDPRPVEGSAGEMESAPDGGTGACPGREPKSISRETTIEGGTIDLDLLFGLLEYLAERVASTLRSRGLAARSLTVKIGYVDFDRAARRTSLDPATSDEKALLAAALEIFHSLEGRRVALRWVGLSVSGLEAERRQNEMFDARANRRWYLNRGVDAVRDRFGWNAVFYGRGLLLRRRYATKPSGLVLSTPCLSR